MQNTTYVALSQQMALSRQMDVIANNIANSSTPAFKVENSAFKEYLVKGAGKQPVSYVFDTGVYRDMRPGNFSKTDNPLDVAIEGNGYFTVNTPDGPRYTRNGHFQLSADGTVVTSQGYPVMTDTNQPLQALPGTAKIQIAEDGTVTSIIGDGTINSGSAPIGRIGLAQFANPQQLVSAADGLYVASETPSIDTTSTLKQGMVEESNVQSVVELTRLLSIQRAYNSAQQMIDGEDTRVKGALDKLARAA